MIMPEIEFIQTKSIRETLEILAAQRRSARIIAGGTDIIPGMRQNSSRFKGIKKLIDINHLSGLTSILRRNDRLHIGAAVTFSRIAKDKKVLQMFPLLANAAGKIGSVQIQNRATIGGNCVNNAPCADSVPPLLVYNARLKIISLRGTRHISLDQFLKGSYSTQLRSDELVSAVILPVTPPGYRGVFYKLGRRRGVAVSRISLAILLKYSRGKIVDLRVASGAVTPIGVRLAGVEQMIIGQIPKTELLKDLASTLGEEILKITGVRWSTPYKLPVVQQVFYQLINELIETK